MTEADVVVISGSTAVLVTAVTGKSCYPDKELLLIRKESTVVVPCGIPYIFGFLENSDQDVIPATALQNLGLEI